MHDINPDRINRLAEYLAGEMAPHERLVFENELREQPMLDALSAYLRKPGEVDAMGHTFSQSDTVEQIEAMSAHLKAAVREQSSELDGWSQPNGPTTSRVRESSRNMARSGRSLLRLATTGWSRPVAIIAGAFCAVLAWYGFTRTSTAVDPNRSFVYMTAPGEQATVRLPDGSLARLNVATRLEVPADYDRGNRTLRLEGEALFTTEHKTGSPFTVIAGPSATRVLGTTFSIRYYATDTAASVAVGDGKVSVRSMVLVAGQRVLVTAQNVREVNTTPNDITFAYSKLVLNDVSLLSAIRELNRWYGADIQVGDSSLNNKRVFGVFPIGSITDLATMLEWTFHLRVVRDGSMLTLYPKE